MKAIACFETSSASRYLAMICQHFGRRVKAQCDATQGWIQFPFGRCDMAADGTQLEMVALADDPTQLAQVTQVITSHVERFAFRENPMLHWKTPPDIGAGPHPDSH